MKLMMPSAFTELFYTAGNISSFPFMGKYMNELSWLAAKPIS